MDVTQLDTGAADREQRLQDAIRNTAPGTPLRVALDMILAGHLGALVCVGDTENVLAAGDDGFKLDVSFTANRLFELCKMDGAVVVDRDFTRILRANYHLNPDPSLPTSETGTRHRTAARMSLLTKAMVVSVSSRRSVINVYVDGKGFQVKPGERPAHHRQPADGRHAEHPLPARPQPAAPHEPRARQHGHAR